MKKSIYKAVFSGKLTKQNYLDDAKQLMQIINQNSIKKNKRKIDLNEVETPYEIPDNWVFTSFESVLDVRDGTHDTPKYHSTGIPLVTSKNLTNGHIDFSSCKFISIEDSTKINQRSLVESNDILFAMIGSIGNPVLVNKDRDFSVKNMAIFKNNINIDMQYIYYFLQHEQDKIRKISSGGVQSFVSLKFLRTYIFPLPPFEEQKRIVEKLNKLLPLIDSLEKDELKLKYLMQQFPLKMKKAIFKHALAGKIIVNQEYESIPADMLLNSSDYIGSQVDILEHIPSYWSVEKLNSLAKLVNPPVASRGKYNYLDVKYLRGKNTSEIKNSGRFITEGTKLILVDGENSGEIFVVQEDGYMGSTFRVLELSDENNWPYLSIYFDYHKTTFKNNKIGAAIPHLNKKLFNDLLVALPPLSEQEKIVYKVKEILPLVENLSS